MAAPSGVCAAAVVAGTTTSAMPTIVVDHRLTSTAALTPDSMDGEHISGVMASLRKVEEVERLATHASGASCAGNRSPIRAGVRRDGVWRSFGHGTLSQTRKG